MPVSIDPDMYVSDEHAKRFSRYMLQDIKVHNDRADAAMENMLSPSIGNPKGQKRMWGRFVRSMGPAFLSGILITGKRCKFKLLWEEFRVENNRLTIVQSSFENDGQFKTDTHDPTRSHNTTILEFSTHALQRLIQRAGIRESDDYLPLLSALAIPAIILSKAVIENDGIPSGRTWPLPITVNGERILLMTRADDISHYKRPIVATIYKGEWANYQEVARLDRWMTEWLDFMKALHNKKHDPEYKPKSTKQWVTAFTEASFYFRREVYQLAG